MKNNIKELTLSELNFAEQAAISGGDKFMNDLGHAFGYAYTWFVNTLANADLSHSGLHEDMR